MSTWRDPRELSDHEIETALFIHKNSPYTQNRAGRIIALMAEQTRRITSAHTEALKEDERLFPKPAQPKKPGRERGEKP